MEVRKIIRDNADYVIEKDGGIHHGYLWLTQEELDNGYLMRQELKNRARITLRKLDEQKLSSHEETPTGPW